jgi:hypothetical protein
MEATDRPKPRKRSTWGGHKAGCIGQQLQNQQRQVSSKDFFNRIERSNERRRRAVNTFQLNWGQLGPNYKVAMEVERFEAVSEAWHESFEVVSGLPGCEGMPTVSKSWAYNRFIVNRQSRSSGLC